MATKTYTCGCSISFGEANEVRAVTCCALPGLFSEHKSLRQLSLDIQDHQLKLEFPPPAPEPDPAPDASSAASTTK